MPQLTLNPGLTLTGFRTTRPSMVYRGRSPSLGACNYPIFLSGVFTDRSIFSLHLSQIQIPKGTLVTNCKYKHGLMSTWCRRVHVRPHCFILTEACSCRLELAYFAGKISKNRLVCKNAVALAYCGSCRLLVMDFWQGFIVKNIDGESTEANNLNHIL